MILDTLQIYYQELNCSYKLSHQEETKLARQMRDDKEKLQHAKDPSQEKQLLSQIGSMEERLLKSQLRWIASIANRFDNEGDVEDLIQEGNMAALRVIRGFDLSRGYRLVTPVGSAVRNAIGRYLKKNYRNKPFTNRDNGRLEKDVFREDADKIKISNAREPANVLMRKEADECLTREINELDLKKSGVIKARFGIGQEQQTLESIGKSKGVCKQYIARLEICAKNQLKEKLEYLLPA